MGVSKSGGSSSRGGADRSSSASRGSTRKADQTRSADKDPVKGSSQGPGSRETRGPGGGSGPQEPSGGPGDSPTRGVTDTIESPSRELAEEGEESSPEQAHGHDLVSGLNEAFSMSDEQREAVDTIAESYRTAWDGTPHAAGERTGEMTTEGTAAVARGEFQSDWAEYAESAAMDRRVPDLPEEFSDIRDELVEKNTEETHQALNTLGSDPQALDHLDGALSPVDGRFSHSDLTAAAFEHDLNHGFEPGGPAHSTKAWASEPGRTPEVIRAQEEAVLNSVVNGGGVEFTNSLGHTEELSFSQQPLAEGGAGSLHETAASRFTMTDADGRVVDITSDLSPSQTRTGLARLGDYYTQTPGHLRDSVQSFALTREANQSLIDDPTSLRAAADYHYQDKHINFYDGLSGLSDDVFHHEMGHAIGDSIDGDTHRMRSNDWDQHSEQRPSDYAHTNELEDFAESYSMFKEYVDSNRLEEFRETYPHRSAVLESIYSN